MNDGLRIKLGLIAHYQIIGGAIGIILPLVAVLSVIAENVPTTEVMVHLILLSVFCIFNIRSGYLIKWGKYSRGFKLINFSLIMQLMNFKFGPLYYSAVNGVAVNIGLRFEDSVSPDLSLKISQFTATFFAEGATNFFNINIFAIFMLYFVQKVWHETDLSSNHYR